MLNFPENYRPFDYGQSKPGITLPGMVVQKEISLRVPVEEKPKVSVEKLVYEGFVDISPSEPYLVLSLDTSNRGDKKWYKTYEDLITSSTGLQGTKRRRLFSLTKEIDAKPITSSEIHSLFPQEKKGILSIISHASSGERRMISTRMPIQRATGTLAMPFQLREPLERPKLDSRANMFVIDLLTAMDDTGEELSFYVAIGLPDAITRYSLGNGEIDESKFNLFKVKDESDSVEEDIRWTVDNACLRANMLLSDDQHLHTNIWVKKSDIDRAFEMTISLLQTNQLPSVSSSTKSEIEKIITSLRGPKQKIPDVINYPPEQVFSYKRVYEVYVELKNSSPDIADTILKIARKVAFSNPDQDVSTVLTPQEQLLTLKYSITKS